MKAMFVILAGSGLVALANLIDGWYVTVLIGAMIGGLFTRGGRALLLSLLTGLIGWGVPLLWVAPLGNVVKLATLLGGILGLSGAVATVVGLLLPALTGALLTVCGTWMVIAVKSVFVLRLQRIPAQRATVSLDQ